MRWYHRVYPLLLTIVLVVSPFGCGGHSKTTESVLFQKTDILIPGRPYEVTCADFDSDGWDDIAVTVKYSGVHVFFNNGKNFDEHREFTGPFHHGISIKSGDVNGDGRNDIINLFENGVQFFIGDGQGDFVVSEKSLTGPQMSTYIETAHLNEDLLIDLIAVGVRDPRIFVYMNEGNLNFRVSTIDLGLDNTTSAPEFRQASAADLDGDGFNDILVADSRNGIIWVLWNDNKGSFLPAALHTAKARASSPVAYALPGDTLPHVMFSKEIQDGALVLLENRGERIFTEALVIPVYPMPMYLRVADMDADGTQDVIINHLTSEEPLKGRISLVHGPGLDKQHAVTIHGMSLYSCLCDWNRDGLPDVFAPNFSSDSVTYIPSDLLALPVFR